MRKIEREMNQAIARKRDWKKDNTRVIYSPIRDAVEVYLYNNLISIISEGAIQIFDGGRQSNTTKSRLNAIFDGNGCPSEGVFQKQYKWYVRINQGGGNIATVPFFSGMRVN